MTVMSNPCFFIREIDVLNFVERTVFGVLADMLNLPLQKNHMSISTYMYRLNDDLKQEGSRKRNCKGIMFIK